MLTARIAEQGTLSTGSDWLQEFEGVRRATCNSAMRRDAMKSRTTSASLKTAWIEVEEQERRAASTRSRTTSVGAKTMKVEFNEMNQVGETRHGGRATGEIPRAP